MKTIDCTPKWSDIIDIYITALESGGPAARQAAREEIERLARGYDDAIAYVLKLEAA